MISKVSAALVLCFLVVMIPLVNAADYDYLEDMVPYDTVSETPSSYVVGNNYTDATDTNLSSSSRCSSCASPGCTVTCHFQTKFLVPLKTYRTSGNNTLSVRRSNANTDVYYSNFSIPSECLQRDSVPYTNYTELLLNVTQINVWDATIPGAKCTTYVQCYDANPAPLSWLSVGTTISNGCAWSPLISKQGDVYDLKMFWYYNSSVAPVVTELSGLDKAVSAVVFAIVSLVGGTVIAAVGGTVTIFVGGVIIVVGLVALVLAAKWALLDSI